jgi:hypothetical protein
MRLGFINAPGTANALYRAVYPMRALADQGHTVLWPDRGNAEVPMRQLLSCDLVHCFRRADRIADLETLSKHGVAVSVDNDDDLGELGIDSKGASGVKVRVGYARQAARLAAQARVADLVTTPSPVLADKYRRAGAQNVVVIENYLNPNAPCFGFRSKHDGTVVGWVAGIEHAADVAELGITSVLARLLDRHEELRVVTVGVKLQISSHRYEHNPGVAHKDLFKVISTMDVGLAPLVDNSFNQARSNVKLKEYGAGGAAWLASEVEPYLGLGEKQGGSLVRDGDWFGSIDGLLRSGIRRRRLSRRAMKWAKDQTIDRHASVWEREFEGAIARRTDQAVQPGRAAV